MGKGICGREIEEEKVEAWTNLHAFLARLFGRGFGHWRSFGILIFYDALEEHNSAGNTQGAQLQVLAQWIRHAGKAMSSPSTSQNRPVPSRVLIPPGYLYSGEVDSAPRDGLSGLKRNKDLFVGIGQ